MAYCMLAPQNQQLAPPPGYAGRGRRKQALVQLNPQKKSQQEPETVDAERLEDVLVDQDMDQAKIEEALKEVSRKPKK